MTKKLIFLFTVFINITSFGQVTKQIKGQMIDQRTEETIEKCEIMIQNQATKKKFLAETDDNGYFSFINVPIGKYTFHITDKDYTDTKFNFETNAEEHVTKNYVLVHQSMVN